MNHIRAGLCGAIYIASVLMCSAPARAEGSCLATWYGAKHEGRKMANGKTFRKSDPSIVAHRDLPLGTRVRLTNLHNGKKIIAKVEDRGPVSKLFSFDVSEAGAKRLGFIRAGRACLHVELLSRR